MTSRNPAGNYLVAAGVAFGLVGAIFLFAKAGFPPGITPAYDYTAEGVVKTSSPSGIAIAISLVLIVVGAIIAKAGSVAKSVG